MNTALRDRCLYPFPSWLSPLPAGTSVYRWLGWGHWAEVRWVGFGRQSPQTLNSRLQALLPSSECSTDLAPDRNSDRIGWSTAHSQAHHPLVATCTHLGLTNLQPARQHLTYWRWGGRGEGSPLLSLTEGIYGDSGRDELFPGHQADFGIVLGILWLLATMSWPIPGSVAQIFFTKQNYFKKNTRLMYLDWS